MHEATLSLRERNRIDCWTSIHEAAAELTLERGLEAATIEAIAEQAGVSRRTFFNYFPSKEDAVLGMQAPTLPEAAVIDFRTSGGDTFTRTMRLMLAVLDSTIPDHDDFRRRRQLADRHPVLQERVSKHISAAESLAMQVLTPQHQAGETIGPLRSPEQESDAQASARALLSLAATILRYATRNDPEGLVEDRQATIERAIDIFRKAISESL